MTAMRRTETFTSWSGATTGNHTSLTIDLPSGTVEVRGVDAHGLVGLVRVGRLCVQRDAHEPALAAVPSPRWGATDPGVRAQQIGHAWGRIPAEGQRGRIRGVRVPVGGDGAHFEPALAQKRREGGGEPRDEPADLDGADAGGDLKREAAHESPASRRALRESWCLAQA